MTKCFSIRNDKNWPSCLHGMDDESYEYYEYYQYFVILDDDYGRIWFNKSCMSTLKVQIKWYFNKMVVIRDRTIQNANCFKGNLKTKSFYLPFPAQLLANNYDCHLSRHENSFVFGKNYFPLHRFFVFVLVSLLNLNELLHNVGYLIKFTGFFQTLKQNRINKREFFPIFRLLFFVLHIFIFFFLRN